MIQQVAHFADQMFLVLTERGDNDFRALLADFFENLFFAFSKRYAVYEPSSGLALRSMTVSYSSCISLFFMLFLLKAFQLAIKTSAIARMTGRTGTFYLNEQRIPSQSLYID